MEEKVQQGHHDAQDPQVGAVADEHPVYPFHERRLHGAARLVVPQQEGGAEHQSGNCRDQVSHDRDILRRNSEKLEETHEERHDPQDHPEGGICERLCVEQRVQPKRSGQALK